MSNYRIYFDAFQEGKWFESLHPQLAGSELEPFPRRPVGRLAGVLSFDRPDIVLAVGDEPILVLERTIEVPSGHNVGQRFARLAAAAIEGVPCVYFGPYSAYKHGGVTSGPRYMNLRLFKALREVELIERSPVTTIRWPTDRDFEIVRTPDKDRGVAAYLDMFFDLLARERSLPAVARAILRSSFEREQEAERDRFVAREVSRPHQYDQPPSSVLIGVGGSLHPILSGTDWANRRVVVYNVGMTQIRSDPYTGMALLYNYLYCGGVTNRTTPMILHFPSIDVRSWRLAAARAYEPKTIKLFRLSADAIIFRDGMLSGSEL